MSWRKHTERRGYFRKVSPIDTLGSGLNDGRESGLGGRELTLGIKCKGPEAGKELGGGSGSRGDPCGSSEEGVSQGPQKSTITEILEAMVGVLYFIKFHWPTTPRRRLPPQLWTKNKLVFGWWCRCLSTRGPRGPRGPRLLWGSQCSCHLTSQTSQGTTLYPGPSETKTTCPGVNTFSSSRQLDSAISWDKGEGKVACKPRVTDGAPEWAEVLGARKATCTSKAQDKTRAVSSIPSTNIYWEPKI